MCFSFSVSLGHYSTKSFSTTCMLFFSVGNQALVKVSPSWFEVQPWHIITFWSVVLFNTSSPILSWYICPSYYQLKAVFMSRASKKGSSNELVVFCIPPLQSRVQMFLCPDFTVMYEEPRKYEVLPWSQYLHWCIAMMKTPPTTPHRANYTWKVVTWHDRKILQTKSGRKSKWARSITNIFQEHRRHTGRHLSLPKRIGQPSCMKMKSTMIGV